MGIAIELRHISREFPGVRALDGVSFSVEKGEVHALCGENGAGKSTLINIIGGNLQPSSGTLFIDGQEVFIADPIQARKYGIAVVHQEKSLVDSLSIADNIYAGMQPTNKWGIIDVKLLHERTRVLLKKLRLDFPPQMLVGNLSPSHKQVVEIAKALARQPSILLLDEPTASITGQETELLFTIIRELCAEGVSVIYISHRMGEIFSIADRVSVLKDGKYQGVWRVSETNVDQLIRSMVGREIAQLGSDAGVKGAPLLEVKNISGKGIRDVSFTVHRGEIVGLAGLIGSGRTEIARAIFGDLRLRSGEIWIKDKKVDIRSTLQAIAAGIGLVPEERKSQAIFQDMTVEENMISADLRAATVRGWFSRRKMYSVAAHYRQLLRIAASGKKMSTLSGGNQQKIVLTRWLLRDPDVLIFDEPTHGVDIGVKIEIYQLMRELAARGKGILLISSELPELLLLSHTVLVVRNGSIMRKMDRSEATEESVMQAACGF